MDIRRLTQHSTAALPGGAQLTNNSVLFPSAFSRNAENWVCSWNKMECSTLITLHMGI